MAQRLLPEGPGSAGRRPGSEAPRGSAAAPLALVRRGGSARPRAGRGPAHLRRRGTDSAPSVAAPTSRRPLCRGWRWLSSFDLSAHFATLWSEMGGRGAEARGRGIPSGRAFRIVQSFGRCVSRGGGQGLRIFFHPLKCTVSFGIPKALWEPVHPPHLLGFALLTPSHTSPAAFSAGWVGGIRSPQPARRRTGAPGRISRPQAGAGGGRREGRPSRVGARARARPGAPRTLRRLGMAPRSPGGATAARGPPCAPPQRAVGEGDPERSPEPCGSHSEAFSRAT